MAFQPCFCGLKISFQGTVGALCCNVQISTNLSPNIMSEFTITCHTCVKVLGSRQVRNHRSFLSVCYRLRGCFPLTHRELQGPDEMTDKG